MSATSLSTALMTGTTTTVASPGVELTALITPANSTAQIFASSDYYGRPWVSQYGQPQVVPFFLGPQGIVTAIDQNAATDPTGKIAVLSSGWGAGQTSTALAIMQSNNDPARKNLELVVLDNNTNRAGGGFWTTYWMFAPLLLTSAAPTPGNTNMPILDTAYEYNINSDAPTYPINLLADANSLVAYAYDYGAQSTAPMPQAAIDEAKNTTPGTPHYHYVVAPDGTYTRTLVPGSNITYVTFQSDGLPLVRPLRMLPGGNIVADAVEPTLTVLVNWGYQDNSPIPQDPSVTRPVGLLPPMSQTVATANQLPGAVQDGAHAVQQDLSSPGSVLTNPLSGVASPLTSVPKSTSTVDMTHGYKVIPGSGTTGTPSSAGANPVKQVVGGVTSAVAGFAHSLTNGAQTAGGAASSTAKGSQ